MPVVRQEGVFTIHGCRHRCVLPTMAFPSWRDTMLEARRHRCLCSRAGPAKRPVWSVECANRDGLHISVGLLAVSGRLTRYRAACVRG